MSSWYQFYYIILNSLFSIYIKNKIIPLHLLPEYNIDLTQPVLYILPYNSKFDLLILQKQCLKYNLPDPLTKLESHNYSLPCYLFIDDSNGIFSHCLSNTQFIKILRDYLDFLYCNPQLDIQIIPVWMIWGRSWNFKIRCESKSSYIFQKIKNFFYFY
ncbi:hypothetical protein HHS_01290 [Candidatus Pantoea carbekii]|uniref:Glycerol-3-phosphate 1-O-acyltransferase n=1 Tax=Candidatus Pantoea carbekii TaxID=1235990 RepID=U3U771_9GAMM|nr:hypothetical protein HHS_01290 [Candidatus Pantoea carbekii]